MKLAIAVGALVLAEAWTSPARAADPVVVGPEITTAEPSYGLAILQSVASVACGPDRCVAVWQGLDGAYAMVTDADGVPVRKSALEIDGLTSWQSVVYAGDGVTGGDLIVGTVDGGDIRLVRLASDGTAAASATLAVSSVGVSELGLGWNGSRLLIVYGEGGTGAMSAVPVDTNLAMLGPPVSVATPTNYNRALVRSGNELVFLTSTQAWTLAADGHPRIGPIALPLDGTNTYGVWAVSANGTPVVYNLGTTGKLFTLGPNLEIVASINTSASGGFAFGSTLAWNGTNILLAQPDQSSTTIHTRRYTVDPLAALDTANVSLAEDSVPLVVGRGGEFMLMSYRSAGFTPPEYGIYSLPLNAGGRPRATSETLISITAYAQQQPLAAALPSGFVVTASEGPFYAGLMPLGTDGRPVAGRPAAAGLLVDKSQRPYAIGVSPTGGTAVIAGGGNGIVYGIRFDAQGAVLDPLPPQLTQPAVPDRGGIAWNGTNFFWFIDSLLRIVGMNGVFGQPIYFAGYIRPLQMVARSIGGTTLVAWLDTYVPAGVVGVQLKTMRLDGAGVALDAEPINIGSTFPTPGTGLALSDDGTRYLALFDAVTTEGNGALTSELRAIRLGANGRALDASPTVLRRVTGGPPDPIGVATPALSTPTLAYDGALFWAVWREVGAGVWVRRIGGDGQVVDAQPVKLLDEPFGNYDIASRGDGKVLLVYDRFDPAPDVQVSRVKARLMGTTGTGGAGGGGGTGTGGRDGASGGSGGTGGAAGGGTAGSAGGGAGAGGGATGSGTGGTSATGGAPGTGGGGASAGSAGASAGSGGTPDAGASDSGMTSGSSGGCGCATGGSGRSSARAIAWLGPALMLVLARARRRRRR